MKYLVLFELGKKRFMEAFTSRNEAVNAINSFTEIADDVILSISAYAVDKYRIVFEDGSEATIRILKSEKETILGYYPADLFRIFNKIRAILYSKRANVENAQKDAEDTKKQKAKARIEAFALILAGIGIILGGFAIAVAALVPTGEAWQFAALGSLLALGFASIIRGGYLMIKPLPKAKITKTKKAKLATQAA